MYSGGVRGKLNRFIGGNPTMTEEEIRAEKAYRLQERLGHLIGAQSPAPAWALALASQEADEWEKDYRASLAPRGTTTQQTMNL